MTLTMGNQSLIFDLNRTFTYRIEAIENNDRLKRLLRSKNSFMYDLASKNEYFAFTVRDEIEELLTNFERCLN